MVRGRIIHNVQVYKTYIVPLHCVNFSVYHDETQHVLWRIENGELDGFSPKVIVIMVGTHNVSHTPEEVVRGILAVVEKAREKQPQAAMIVMVCQRLLKYGSYNHSDFDA
ncbi:hypothetical protein X801_02768 [Opisthorchis viverrini]|uniref:SGNH hydrolase-type esterase domain-containing protein n=1 Tax=Opisthorchis viverrini TaxID=6198 RepID=A0A1S8X3T3_OPIVI|nr:hypothetical protein X801_02768 [Opisthorchis viverrini]